MTTKNEQAIKLIGRLNKTSYNVCYDFNGCGGRKIKDSVIDKTRNTNRNTIIKLYKLITGDNPTQEEIEKMDLD